MKTRHTNNINKPAADKKGLQIRPEQLQSTNTVNTDTVIPGTAEAGVSATSEVATASQQSPAAVDIAQRKQNRSLPTERVLELLHHLLPRAYELSEVVGKWIWVTFTDKQPAEVTSQLSQLGFHWNSRRKTWQHPCGVFKGELSDPRTKYQSFHPADLVAA